MRRPEAAAANVNLTPMIDVVFQMIIFFVCTVQLDREALSEFIELAKAPNAPELSAEKDPRTITIEVDREGKVFIARTRLGPERLARVLRKASLEHGGEHAPVPARIRADGRAEHAAVQAVMDACAAAGMGELSFIALHEER
ncbi:ExbD/TolR family protein [Kiritimatiella glycovorans]|uniref:Protein TolR n=1 Tax=Kiritimatiella glycovorans TaxID=1307763 RepID=A0A0G3EDC4_9BACT|nr:biopolymer transporter ExbD [Kiritimatiella glycovorans]AKJ63367.1 protein TolR [Kiritimatiella glycovorans]